MTNVGSMLKQFAVIRKAYGKFLYSSLKNQNFSPSEIDIMIFLFHNPTINTSKELVVCLAVSKSLIARSVDGLIQKGLLEMQEDCNDHRVQHLKLTNAALPYIEEIKKYRDRFTKCALTGIEEEDLKCMEATMKKIENNMLEIIQGEKEL